MAIEYETERAHIGTDTSPALPVIAPMVALPTNAFAQMPKTQNSENANSRELKAAAADAAVKQELARQYASEALKTANLKALRLAKEASEQAAKTKPRSKVVRKKG